MALDRSHRRRGAALAGGEAPEPPPTRFRRLPRARLLGLEVPVAATSISRLLGLALLDPGRAGPGLLIPRCSSVHTFGMRFALDILFLGERGTVIAWRLGTGPARLIRFAGADAVLEVVADRAVPGLEAQPGRVAVALQPQPADGVVEERPVRAPPQ